MTLNDGWSAAITQASAREFRESYTEQSWTKSYLTRALTVGELTQIYFGNVDRNTISQDMQNLMQDRYTTIYSIDSKNLPDELYTRVLRSSRNYGSFGSFDSSMVFMTLMAVNNEFYAVLLDEKNNNVDLVPAGTYN